MILGHLCMIGSLGMLVLDKQSQELGDVIKGLVFAGLVFYIAGKYCDKQT